MSLAGSVGSLAHVLEATFKTYYTGEGSDDMMSVVSVDDVPKSLKKLMTRHKAHHAEPAAPTTVLELPITSVEGAGDGEAGEEGTEGEQSGDAAGSNDKRLNADGVDTTAEDAPVEIDEAGGDYGADADADAAVAGAAAAAADANAAESHAAAAGGAPVFLDIADGGSDDGSEGESESDDDDDAGVADAAAIEEMGGDELDAQIFSALRRINQDRRASLKHAVELVEYLKQQTEAAAEADTREAQSIKSQGLLVKAEIPVGESQLTVDSSVLARFGKFGENLIVARQLIDRHKVSLLQRSGNLAFAGAAELPQLRAEEPNYLESTSSMTFRAGVIADEIKARAARKVAAAADSDDGGGYGHDEMLGSEANAAEESEEHERRLKKLARSRARARKMAREKLTGAEHDANDKVLDRMHRKVQFLRNPRFAGAATGPIGPGTQVGEPAPAFRAEPAEVIFTDYEPVVGGVDEPYSFKLSLRNITMPALTRRLRVIPPTSPFFEIEQPNFPGKKWRPKAQDDHPDIANGAVTGEVAPGMAAEVIVRFAPRSRGTYATTIVLVAEAEKGATQRLEVVVRAQRRPHHLSLPKRVQCDACLVGKRVTTTVKVVNSGGSARFVLRAPRNAAAAHRHHHGQVGGAPIRGLRHPRTNGALPINGGAFAEGGPSSAWGATAAVSTEARPESDAVVSAAGSGFVVQESQALSTMQLPPCFTVCPTHFELGTNESCLVTFTFAPTRVGEVVSAFELVVDEEEDNVDVYEVVGPGCEAELISDAIDGTQCFSDDVPTLMLGSATLGCPSATVSRTLTLRNPTPLALDFAWRLLSADGEGHSLPFTITPMAANFSPHATMDFTFGFTPERLGSTAAIATLTADGVPDTLREITVIGRGDAVTMTLEPPVLLCEATCVGSCALPAAQCFPSSPSSLSLPSVPPLSIPQLPRHVDWRRRHASQHVARTGDVQVAPVSGQRCGGNPSDAFRGHARAALGAFDPDPVDAVRRERRRSLRLRRHAGGVRDRRQPPLRRCGR